MRRNLFLALIAILFNSCSSSIVAVRTSTALDYAKYQKEGLFLTESNSVNFNYEPLASVSSLHLAGVKDLNEAKKQVRRDYFNETDIKDVTATKNWYVPTRELALLDLCNKAKELGANGIINIKINYISYPEGKEIVRTGYEATGMAIKK